MTRSIDLDSNGFFVVGDDPDQLIGGMLSLAFGTWGAGVVARFEPDGPGIWVDTLGGATRVSDADQLIPPYDASIDLDRTELWLIEREHRDRANESMILTGDELRDLLGRARSLVG